MTGKANAVFWMGLILIALNFWVSGQSAVLWGAFTGTSTSTPPKKSNNGSGAKMPSKPPIGMR